MHRASVQESRSVRPTRAPGAEAMRAHGRQPLWMRHLAGGACPSGAAPERLGGHEPGGERVLGLSGARRITPVAARGAPRGLTGLGRGGDIGLVTRGGGGDGGGTAAGADPGEHRPVPRAQDAVRADGAAATGAGPPGPAPIEVVARSRGRVLVRQRAVALFPREDTGVAEGHAHAGRGQVSEGGRATADGRAGHDPVRVPDVGLDERAQGGRLSGRAERRANASRLGGDVDQAVWAGRPPGAHGRAAFAPLRGSRALAVCSRAGRAHSCGESSRGGGWTRSPT